MILLEEHNPVERQSRLYSLCEIYFKANKAKMTTYKITHILVRKLEH